ncbi:MFS transporter [bacterium]|nr:MFS transporter [bacterium]
MPSTPATSAEKREQHIDTRKQQRQILILAVLAFASTFSTAVVFPNIGSFVRDRFVLNDTQASLFAVSYLIPHVVFAFVWGAVSDRIGRRKGLLIIGYVITAAFHFALPFISTYPMLLIVRFGEGAFSILGFSMVMTMAVDRAREGNYGRVMGAVGAAVSLGTTLAFPIGGAIGASSMVLLCSIGAVILLLCALLAWQQLEEGRFETVRSLREATKALRRSPSLAIPYAFTFVDRFTVGFFAVTFPLYVATAFGMDARASGMLLTGYLLPFSLLIYPFGRLSDRWGGARLILGASLLYGVAVLGVGLLSPGWFFPVMVLCGIFAAAMYAPSLWFVAHVAPVESRASAMGGFNAAGSLGFALGPLAGAVISDLFSYQVAFISAGVTEFLCVLIAWPFVMRFLSRRNSSVASPAAS